MPQSDRSAPSRQLLAAIVDSSDDAIVSKDLDGIITSWNPAAERIFGYSASEAVGKPILMLIPEDRKEEEPQILERIRRGERLEHFETIRRRKDGQFIHVVATISPIRNDQGTIIGASKIARDITPQLKLKEQLHGSEERFRTTLSSIGDAVIATDREGKVTFMNAVAEALTGWKEEEAKGQLLPTVFKIVNAFTRESVENPVEKVLRTGGIVGLANHTILLGKDGKEHPIDDSGAPIHGPGGAIAGVVLVFRDVTERRAAEIAVQRLAAVVHGSEDAIIAKDLNGVVTSWNQGASRIFGYSDEEMIGKSILTLIPPELHDEEKQIIERLKRGERIDHFETIRRTKDGRLLEISLSVSPIRDDEGLIVGASKIARNVTERRQIERQLASARSELQAYAEQLEKKVEDRTRVLQQTVKELESFSYSLTHDLRAPLRAIQGHQQILLEDHASDLKATALRAIDKTIAAAKRMDEMILDLLAFTRLSHEEMPLGPVDVEALVRGIIRDREDLQAPKAQITIRSPLEKVVGNERSLIQCLSNLLDNSVKFVAPGVTPQIQVYCEPVDSDVRIYVKDNGIGISPEEQSQLFRLFNRLHGSQYSGTGIGLAIVLKAAQRMGGTAGLESETRQGSRFWVQLPRIV